jgi:hypothetical protein
MRFFTMMLQHISVWLYGSDQAGIIPGAESVVATEITVPQSDRLLLVELYEKRGLRKK